MRDSKQANSLLICTTPLQMILAEKIIESLPSNNFNLLVLVHSDNQKYQYYYTRLKSKCQNSVYYTLEQGVVGFIKFIRMINYKKININYSNIYLASIDSSYCQYMLSCSEHPNIFTFDDGTANIVSNSLYYQDIYYSRLKRLVRKLLGIKYTINDIKMKSLMHYTLYKDIPNIIENTKVLSLTDNIHFNYKINEEASKPINIYLGQPLNELSDFFSSDKLNSILLNLNITHYFPHPREERLPSGNYKIINTSLVFEDYIINLIKNNTFNINIFSFISTTLLNIADIEQIKVHYILHPELECDFQELYDLACNHFNIPLVKVH